MLLLVGHTTQGRNWGGGIEGSCRRAQQAGGRKTA